MTNPMDQDSYESLAELADLHHEECWHRLEGILARLEAVDLEVAAQAIHVFDDRRDAAVWLASPVISLGGISPLRALAEGKRDEVVRVLNSIMYGIPG